ncbi:hypothetical protein ACGFW5_21745 [Streptomyces sp. NPDC048416]|uniref:hypothetical protein n=1 Tax=Streptomyces sp. NPDC048416 TaxID=3365546 RepID=UPI00371421D7
MNVRQKFVSGAFAGALVLAGVAAAAPAGAISNVGCNNNTLHEWSYTHDYCYAGSGDGWANISEVYKTTSGNSGSVTDISVQGVNHSVPLSAGMTVNYEQRYGSWGNVYGVHIKYIP